MSHGEEHLRRPKIDDHRCDPERIYEQVVDFPAWTEWSPWEGLDPDQQRTFTGSDSGVGAKYAWSGNRRAGSGTMEVTEASAPSKVRIALEFVKPFRSSNVTAFLITSQSAGTSHVACEMTGPRSLAVKIMGVLRSMDSMIGKDFERGLGPARVRGGGGTAV